jgi:hypothetical protein
MRAIRSRWMRWSGHVACMEALRYEYEILVSNPEGKRSIYRPRYQQENYIKM